MLPLHGQGTAAVEDLNVSLGRDYLISYVSLGYVFVKQPVLRFAEFLI